LRIPLCGLPGLFDGRVRDLDHARVFLLGGEFLGWEREAGGTAALFLLVWDVDVSADFLVLQFRELFIGQEHFEIAFLVQRNAAGVSEHDLDLGTGPWGRIQHGRVAVFEEDAAVTKARAADLDGFHLSAVRVQIDRQQPGMIGFDSGGPGANGHREPGIPGFEPFHFCVGKWRVEFALVADTAKVNAQLGTRLPKGHAGLYVDPGNRRPVCRLRTEPR